MKAGPLDQEIIDSTFNSSNLRHNSYGVTEQLNRRQSLLSGADIRLSALGEQAPRTATKPRASSAAQGMIFDPVWKRLSPWSRSTAKRLFDCLCVLASLPVIAPLLLVIAAAVRLTSRGPVLFLQERMGRHGKAFTIIKFRTMVHVANRAHNPITTSDNQRFTSIGQLLRRSKLDELPQLINVLLGHMSLVGPRPKMREHVVFDLPCRPGITGMATTVFACEESILTRIPANRLDAFYHAVVLPAKRKLDAEYMSKATFVTDLHLIVRSILRRWNTSALDGFIVAATIQIENEMIQAKASDTQRIVARRPIPAPAAHPAGVEQVSAF